jgi:hypothetical protein
VYIGFNFLKLVILGVILVFSPKAGNEFLHPLVNQSNNPGESVTPEHSISGQAFSSFTT